MSEEMARKKREEIKEFEKREVSILKEIKDDRCPSCGTPTSKLEFINEMIVKTFGWVECTTCGTVYCPRSIMNQKRVLARSGLTPAIHTPDGPPATITVE
jgi:hypothetical protein